MLKINSLDDFKNYANGVLGRALCHAPNVKDLILPLAGAVIINGKDICVREYNGRPANMIWFTKGTKRYCFHYDHEHETVKLFDRSFKGTMITELDKDTSNQDIIDLFAKL